MRKLTIFYISIYAIFQSTPYVNQFSLGVCFYCKTGSTTIFFIFYQAPPELSFTEKWVIAGITKCLNQFCWRVTELHLLRNILQQLIFYRHFVLQKEAYSSLLKLFQSIPSWPSDLSGTFLAFLLGFQL